MLVALAEAICLSDEGEAWSRICEYQDSFIWSDDEDPAATWNRIVGVRLGTQVQLAWVDGKAELSYRGNRSLIPLVFDREDALITLHALAGMVKQDSEIRLCRDSVHSSDKAFLSLAPQAWIALEAKLSRAVVGGHFCSLHQSYAEFTQDAFPDSPVAPGTLDASLTEWGGAGYAPSKLDYSNVLHSDGQVRSEVLSQIIRKYIEPGQVEVKYYGASDVSLVDRGNVLESIRHRIGHEAIRIAGSEYRGFVVIEANGAAAGWRSDGGILDQPNDKPWWRFWHREDDQ